MQRKSSCFGPLLVLLLFLGGSLASSASSGDWQWLRRRSPQPAETASSSSNELVLSRVGSSVVFKVHGNVYPTGFYNVTLCVGQPPKPYFVDPDTGSDLTWLQCDAPCSRCTEAPHPLYRPSNDLVHCRDPLCASLQSPGGYKCDNPMQCDYEVEYADGGSSLGVLVRDLFPLKFTNGKRLAPRLAIGFVTLITLFACLPMILNIFVFTNL